MSETTTDASKSTSTPEAKREPASPESRRSAHRAVDAMLQHKYRTTRLDSDGSTKPSTGPVDDYVDTYYKLGQPQPHERYSGGTPIKLERLKTGDGEEPFKGKDLTLWEVRGGTEDGKFLYCYAKGADGKVVMKDGMTDEDDLDQRVRIELPRAEVQLLLLKSQPDEYAGLFDGVKKDLVESVIKDDGELPATLETTIDAVKAETGMPIRDADMPAEKSKEATTTIPEHLADANESLDDQIAYLKNRLEHGNLDEKMRARAERVFRQLNAAKKINGDLGGALYKTAAMYASKGLWADLGDTELIVGATDKAIEALSDHVADAKDEIIDIIRDEAPGEQAEQLIQLADNAGTVEEVTALMKGLSTLNLPDMTDRVFGEGVNDARAQMLMDEIIENSGFDHNQKEILKKVGKGALWALLGALIASGGIIVGGGFVAINTATSMSGGGGRR